MRHGQNVQRPHRILRPSPPRPHRSSWLEHYTLQSGAIQAAFADLNADVASGTIPCPVASAAYAPPKPTGCPLQPNIHASAFASASFPATFDAGGSPYAATYPGDFYPNAFGNLTVAAEHVAFPPWPALAQDASVQNLHTYSMHSCALWIETRHCLWMLRWPFLPHSLRHEAHGPC